MLGRYDLLKRARSLAQSGRYATLSALRLELRKEGFQHVDQVLDERSVMQDLQGVCDSSCGRHPS